MAAAAKEANDRPTVLVDARNVIRSRWPNLPEETFVDLARAWAKGEDVDAVIVFDGKAPGYGAGAWELDDGTRIVGAGGSADDWIAENAARLARERRRLWLVSSDRGLRARVAPHVERTIGGGSLAGQLTALDGESRRSA